MTARARRRLGLRSSFRLWLTPLGERVAGAVGFLAFLALIWALAAMG